MPLKAIKGKIVVSFIIDHTIVETTHNYIGLKPWDWYFDGLSHKEGIGIIVLIISPKGIPTKFKFIIKNHCSNNEAKYEALIASLEILLDFGAKRVVIRGDAKFLLKKITQE